MYRFCIIDRSGRVARETKLAFETDMQAFETTMRLAVGAHIEVWTEQRLLFNINLRGCVRLSRRRVPVPHRPRAAELEEHGEHCL